VKSLLLACWSSHVSSECRCRVTGEVGRSEVTAVLAARVGEVQSAS